MQFDDWTAIYPDGYYLRRFSMSEHAGTHVSAPTSFHPGGKTVDEYEVRDLVQPAVVIDIRQQCSRDRDYALTLDDLGKWESRHGEVPSGSLALLLTGWPERWNDPAAYLGCDGSGALHFPGFGPEAAALLVRERCVSGLGTDTAGVEPGVDAAFTVSTMALASNLIVLQNLTNLDRLPAKGAFLVIGLLKLEGGSGSPAVVTAFVP